VVVKVLVIDSVEDPGAVPVIFTGVVTVQVPGLLAAVGVIAQVRFTFPVKPAAGVIVIATLLPVVAPAWKLIDPVLVSAKLGGAFTVTFTAVLEVTLPVDASLPVTVTT
jgi:hypothetical protein